MVSIRRPKRLLSGESRWGKTLSERDEGDYQEARTNDEKSALEIKPRNTILMQEFGAILTQSRRLSFFISVNSTLNPTSHAILKSTRFIIIRSALVNCKGSSFNVA